MKEVYKKLLEKLKSMTPEEKQDEYKKLEPWNNIGERIQTDKNHINEEYIIEYESLHLTKPYILTFKSFQDMETKLNNLREYNKLHLVYFNIKVKKITSETINI